ncbi:MAG: hypothetical protein OEY22_11770 [Candidatus Bathyarchaeota archaeon]|nr:hypothetical protein [Candidatus Bathyarchaeota archaeon]MDH5786797.1 hypothetical protein [Candidatus Bathyarchaeota archaeon]
MKENKRMGTPVERTIGDLLSTLLGFRTKSEKELLALQNETKLAGNANIEKESKMILLEAEAQKGQAIELMNKLQKC